MLWDAKRAKGHQGFCAGKAREGGKGGLKEEEVMEGEGASTFGHFLFCDR